MCGRVTLTLDKESILNILGDLFDVKNEAPISNVPDYNIGPSKDLLAIINNHNMNKAGYLKWGLVPSFSKDTHHAYSMINARCETIDIKPSFKKSFESKRCILLADSFYEWKRDKKKQVFRFQLKDQILMPFAGIYSSYTQNDGSKLYTCSILTCEANELMSKIHHRMPLILNQTSSKTWLDNKSSSKDLKALFNPYPSQQMTSYEVSSYVNSIKNNSIACIQPANQQESLF
jgi:putative SOS response-associated peptidase YedK